MALIGANTTLTLDGVTTIDVNGVDQYNWAASLLQGMYIDPSANDLILTLNFADDWVASQIVATGSIRTVINDDPLAGSRYVDSIQLAQGADTVSLSRTNVEALVTQGGDDLIEIDEIWVGWLHAGTGNDTVTIGANAWINTLDLGEGTNICTIEAGVAGIDCISGRTGVDTIYAYGDVDIITTRDSNDRIETDGNSVDMIDAGSGEDTVIAHGDVGTITARAGNDRIETLGNWVDLLDTGSGLDTIIAEGSVRTIVSGSGADSVTTAEGSWTHLINGGDGNDLLLISGESDFIDGGYGNDTITTGTDWIGNIDAAAGRDVVTLGGGTTIFVDLGHDADTLNVGIQLDPSDRIVAKGGSTVWDAGGTDSDIVSFAGFTAGVEVRLDLERAKSTQGNLTLHDFEHATGGSGADLMVGDGMDNVLRGNAGNDTLTGGAGRDGLVGGLGADTFRFYKVDSKADYVSDFKRVQGDKIDLRLLDADTTRAGDQAFTFIGTQSFHDRAGEVRVTDGEGWLRLSGDTDGDGSAEFNIVLYANASSSDIRAADFLL